MRQRDVFSDQASIASWALFTLHRKKLYEYRNANEQNISVKMRSPEHYSLLTIQWQVFAVFSRYRAGVAALCQAERDWRLLVI
ncbi:hypothetical protein F0H84_26065 [Escherichia coli]|nr:hypothetical protein [Escherichia coli]